MEEEVAVAEEGDQVEEDACSACPDSGFSAARHYETAGDFLATHIKLLLPISALSHTAG